MLCLLEVLKPPAPYRKHELLTPDGATPLPVQSNTCSIRSNHPKQPSEAAIRSSHPDQPSGSSNFVTRNDISERQGQPK